ncbi:flagellar filament capping protein FliD [Tissierella sp. MSJ-40]|uniref:Flagellar hook-associated protein 2 n=1 Tax=Tissierella simiarum TaxID=2841534 RepID=A0ABS6E2V7_9FIRM|nr:flagellar filament capping protein FliD [Tissierella simiarum]MBU5436599.1 flagellar filament capping protein FliD [Tissierella simiarum]
MNTMRISGLASGIDTEEIINNLMKVERLKVDRVFRDRQTLVWRQETYNSLNKDFANFIMNTRKSFGLTQVTYKGTLYPNSYKNLTWVKKATSSREDIATVSSTSKAVNGNFQLEVKELAKGATFVSGEKIGESETFGTELEFELIAGKDKNGDDIKKLIKVENSKGVTINDIVNKINAAKVEMFDGKIVTDGKIVEDGAPRELTEEEMKQVKEVSLGVTAFYDKENERLFLQTTETGDKSRINITSNNNEFMNKLNIPAGGVKGTNAKVEYNGVELHYSSNNFNINGIDIEIKSKGMTTIKVDTDVDGIIEKVEQFVEEYNKLVDKTNKLLSEKQYRDYYPLTSEEKKSMDKDDIKLWEEKAKSGILKSDTIVQRIMQNTRTSIYEKINTDGIYKHITEIGISTEKYVKGSLGGKLVIDEDKLKKAILEDPESVMELLFKETKEVKQVIDGEEKVKVEKGGLVSRIYDEMMAGMEEIVNKSGVGDDSDLYRSVRPNMLLNFVTELSSISLLDKDVLQMSRKLDDLEAMLFRKESAYYAKFTAMEKAISRMNSQGAWIGQQFMR